MKNVISIIVLLSVVFTICLAAGLVLPGTGATARAANENVKNPEGSHGSSQAPAIQDALILQGFETLRKLKQPIRVGNGMVVSGGSLAQFLLESQIPVVWGNEGICGGGSCSHQFCTSAGRCSYEDGQAGIDPIYINPSARSQRAGRLERLVIELGHEAFHRMQPFGTGMITCLEEYWAYYVGAQLVDASLPKFEDVDPTDPEQLARWFTLNGMPGYLSLPAYPGGEALDMQSVKVGQTDLSILK